jgi:hypothetical protein
MKSVYAVMRPFAGDPIETATSAWGLAWDWVGGSSPTLDPPTDERGELDALAASLDHAP